ARNRFADIDRRLRLAQRARLELGLLAPVPGPVLLAVVPLVVGSLGMSGNWKKCKSACQRRRTRRIQRFHGHPRGIGAMLGARALAGNWTLGLRAGRMRWESKALKGPCKPVATH